METSRSRVGRLKVLALTVCLSGCALTLEPGFHGSRNDPSKQADPAGMSGPGPMGPYGRMPPPATSDQISQMAQLLSKAEDDRKIQAAKLQQLEDQLREKNQTVVQAAYDVQDSLRQIKKTRDDLQRWRSEMEDLRAKVRTIEQENKVTLETILKTLEGYLEKDPWKNK
jgi:TolA-binding protein